MEQALLDGMKQYGLAAVPLLMLSIAVWQLWKQNIKNDERYHTEKVNDVESKVKMEGALSNLIEIIKTKLK